MCTFVAAILIELQFFFVDSLATQIDVRHTYYSEVSAVYNGQFGPNIVYVSIWPADAMQFSAEQADSGGATRGRALPGSVVVPF